MREIDLEQFWNPIVGNMAWQVRKGYGTFLTMEFGPPHLSVRELAIPPDETKRPIGGLLSRRRVFVQGTWHLWIKYCSWTIEDHFGSEIRILKNGEQGEKNNGEQGDNILQDLEGQILNNVKSDAQKGTLLAEFDLGSKLLISPGFDEAEGPMFSLYGPEKQYSEVRIYADNSIKAFFGNSDEH